MVSFQSPFSFSKDQRSLITIFEDSSSTSINNKKRKRVDDDHHIFSEVETSLHDHRIRNPKSFSDHRLHLGTPPPSELQRFPVVKPGQILFYNTVTHKGTFRSPRDVEVVEMEPTSPRGTVMSLELELNLTCGPRTSSVDSNKLIKNKHDALGTKPQININSAAGTLFMKRASGEKLGELPSLSLSSLSLPSSFEADHDDTQQQQPEMVATVCNRCHMLVMLCKSSPACPNCKFMHPPDHKPPNLLRPKHNLLCFLE